MSQSPPKKAQHPAKMPRSGAHWSGPLSTASSTRSNEIALMRTPAPKPMIRPITRTSMRTRSAAIAPMTSDEAASSPQPKAAPISRPPCGRRSRRARPGAPRPRRTRRPGLGLRALQAAPAREQCRRGRSRGARRRAARCRPRCGERLRFRGRRGSGLGRLKRVTIAQSSAIRLEFGSSRRSSP